MDPPVSEPNATGTKPAATAAALPPELPPGTRWKSHGFSVGPNALVSVELPNANSSMFSLPMGSAPACSAYSTQVAV